MKTITCDRCGVEIDEKIKSTCLPGKAAPLGYTLEILIDNAGDYCKECTQQMKQEMQAILDAKDNHYYDDKEPLCDGCVHFWNEGTTIEKPSKSLIISNEDNFKDSINIDNFISYEIDKDTMSLTIECIVNDIPCRYTIKLHERGAIGVTICGECRYTSDDRTDFLNDTLIRDVIHTLDKGVASDDVEIDISRFVDQSAIGSYGYY